MGFIKPELPDIDGDTWHTLPRATRVQVVTRHWVEHGFGTPYAIYLIYILKIAVYVVAAAAVISLTPGLGGLGHLADWWAQPIVYQKLVIFTLLFEILGLGLGSGPLGGRFWPPIGGVLYWLRPNTIRLPPWPGKVPFTGGDTRTIADVVLCAIVLISGAWALLSPARGGPVTDSGDVGLINPMLVVPMIVALAVLGLRDKTVFLAAWSQHYGLTLLVFFFGFSDQIAGIKIILLALWWGAAITKLNHHSPYVVAVIMSNSPQLRGKAFNWFKRRLYVDPVNDLRPSWVTKAMAYVTAILFEFVVPLCLVFFLQGGPLTWIAIWLMVLFHLSIITSFPAGVPLEWNVFFIFSVFYLFGHYAAIRVTDLSSPVLLIVLIAALVVVPIAGNLFPNKFSTSASMRYGAGSWAACIWCLREGAEEKIESNVTKASDLAARQIGKLFDRTTAEVTLDKLMGWRFMHALGRALNGLVPRAVDEEADYTLRDGEYIGGPLLGWGFGEGHLHNEQLLAAVQRRCHFEEGDVRVIVLEGQPFQTPRQSYRIVDAKTGLIEEGYVNVADMLTRQPWPDPGDRFPVHQTAHRPGVEYAPLQQPQPRS